MGIYIYATPPPGLSTRCGGKESWTEWSVWRGRGASGISELLGIHTEYLSTLQNTLYWSPHITYIYIRQYHLEYPVEYLINDRLYMMTPVYLTYAI